MIRHVMIKYHKNGAIYDDLRREGDLISALERQNYHPEWVPISSGKSPLSLAPYPANIEDRTMAATVIPLSE